MRTNFVENYTKQEVQTSLEVIEKLLKFSSETGGDVIKKENLEYSRLWLVSLLENLLEMETE